MDSGKFKKEKKERESDTMDEVTQVSGKIDKHEAKVQRMMEGYLSEWVNYLILVDTRTHAYHVATNDPMYEEEGTLGRKIERIVAALERLWKFLQVDTPEKPSCCFGVEPMGVDVYRVKHWILVIIGDGYYSRPDEIHQSLRRDLIRLGEGT